MGREKLRQQGPRTFCADSPAPRPMNPQSLLPLLLVLAAGGLIAVQAPTNAMLSKAGGSPILAALISFVVGTLALFFAWLASGNRPGTAAFARVPWYGW